MMGTARPKRKLSNGLKQTTEYDAAGRLAHQVLQERKRNSYADARVINMIGQGN